METTITLLNRLKRKDSVTNTDIWYKTVIKDCVYKKERVTNIDGTTVSVGQQFIILIPFSNSYVPYKDWAKLEDKTGLYTLNMGDIIVLDEVNEDVTDKNVITIKNDYTPYSCEVRSIEEVANKLCVKYQFKIGGV